MKPAARHQTAIEILDEVLAGAPAERALTRWARASRYAGSKDRAAVRDIVFEALRKRTSASARGGSLTGRGLVLGLLSLDGRDTDTVFSGSGYGPAALSDAERHALKAGSGEGLATDVPDWIVPEFEAGLGPATPDVLDALRDRAPVFLRVNQRKANRNQARDALGEDGIVTAPVPEVDTALEVTLGARQVARSRAFRDGWVEVQDASSQAAVAFAPLPARGRILDYCAGGGGKALAMAALSDAEVFAYDDMSSRMGDIPARAARAGVGIRVLDPGDPEGFAPFDLVFCDAPCSGTGAWRRSPDARWRFDPEDLIGLLEVQRDILTKASRLVRPGGHLVHATCSVLAAENRHQLEGWRANAGAGWRVLDEMQRLPDANGDGFYCAVLANAED